MDARARGKVWARCADLEEFAQTIREGGWTGYFCEGDALRFRISSGRCHCGLVRGREAPISKTYCLCCAGHLRYALEHVFGSLVRVDPVSTVISGDDECWFVAHIPNPKQPRPTDG
jgi:predicted hydrocarbon binding protein